MSQLQVINKPKFSVAIQSDTYKNLINRTLGDKDRATRFIASISSAVATNKALQECDAGSILSGALLGESLNLSPSPQLGQYYLVPFNDSKKGYKVAQFQLGYKGYIQLAIRSGQYKKLNVLAIKKGELIKYDPLNEEIEVNLIEDEEERENTETIGYYAMFEYSNGFRKTLYWTKKHMEAHAEKYSMGYKAHKGYTFWEKDFDGMAYKTMLRQLISKWGIMSIDMQKAMEQDMSAINTDGTFEYVDNQEIEEPVLGEQEDNPFNVLDDPNGGEPLPDVLK
ncbi:MAG: recombinase RecT [Clostridia bacterium]|nr:recombinase RecT [Clostridia bacterium]